MKTLQAIGDRKLRRQIEHAVRKSMLEPLFEMVVKRTTCKLHYDKTDLELALDEGVVRAGIAEDKFCEAELELKSGSAVSLLETASTLFAAAPFRLARSSKADRGGYNLLLGRQNESVVPQRAVHPALKGDETCAEALSLFVRSASNQIIANRRAVVETDDPEGTHQLRIGLRRLRSALRAFRPLDDTPALRELKELAQNVARTVGRLRDADVLIADIFAQVAIQMKGEPGFALRQSLLAHRIKARDEVRQALSGEQWAKLQLYLVLWPHTITEDVSLQTPVRDFGTSALRRGWKKVAKLGGTIEELSLEQRHEMRKALKTFRYTVEFFGSLYAKGKVARFVKELRELQEVFGYINDVVSAKQLNAIAHEYCPGGQAAQRAAGCVLGWHDAHAIHSWVAAPKAWYRLKERSWFWVR
jgi:triphosphatase